MWGALSESGGGGDRDRRRRGSSPAVDAGAVGGDAPPHSAAEHPSARGADVGEKEWEMQEREEGRQLSPRRESPSLATAPASASGSTPAPRVPNAERLLDSLVNPAWTLNPTP